MSGSRDYVGTTSKRTGKRKSSGSQTKGGDNGNYIKLFVVFVVAVCVVGGLLYMRMNNKPVKKQEVADTPKMNVVGQKPTEKYSYRKLLEEKEIKTVDINNKSNRNQSLQTPQHELIIDRNPNLSELKADAHRKETKEQEAQRAMDILNGSLNNPKEQITTVKINPNGQTTILDKLSDSRSEKQQIARVDNTVKANKDEGQNNRNGNNNTAKPNNNSTTSKNENVAKVEVNHKSDEIKVLDPKTMKPQAKHDSNKPVENKQNKTVVQNVEAKKNANSSVSFFMQCGAFKSNEQAQTIRSKIAAKGQTAMVQKASTANGIWYRVILGPYTSQSLANDAFSKLKAAKVVTSCNIYRSK